MKISIAIPTSGMKDKEYFLTRCLNSLWDQSLQDFEIVITDNSDDGIIESICNLYKGGIRYYRNPIKGMAQNTNEAIRRSKGQLIKILYMDDFLCDNEALEIMFKRFYNAEDSRWLATGCAHTRDGKFLLKPHIPKYSEDIHTGHNTIGSPSVVMIKNDRPLMFDEKMQWLLDADYYKRLHDKYGEPVIVRDILVAVGIHDGQMTQTMGEERKLQEFNYITEKYA
jgi:glycosyltransferase involved in cell wall biosynthesis